jgi:hypothetical protein
VTSQELLAGLVDELPAPERAEPFIQAKLLPLTLAPIEPAAFVPACVQAAWGSLAPRNEPSATLATTTITPSRRRRAEEPARRR